MKAACAFLIFATAMSAMSEDKKDDDWFTHFRKDRRDPFTFSLKPQIVADPKPREGEDLELKEQNARNLLVRAEDAVMEYRGADCVDACDRALRQIQNISDERPGITALKGNLQALRKAGEKLRQRADAAIAYRKLNLSITGVVARARKAHAIVNGVLVREGQSLTAENETLVIEKISSEQVVVNFRGFRMATAIAAAD